MAISLKINGATRSVDAEPDTPLLYVLRNDLELNGAKYGCGMAQCGTCTVLVDGAATRSCVTPVGSVEGNEVTTLEGLGTLDKPHPLQQAFIDEQAAQCGYCASGMIMAAAGLLDRKPQPHARRTCGQRSPTISAAAAPTTGSSARCYAQPGGGGDMNTKRRDFLKSAAGIVVAFSWSVPPVLAQQPARPRFPAASAPTACWTAGSASTRTAR